jgi:hypothetical protein
LVVADTLQMVSREPPLLLEHEGAQTPDEASLIWVLDVDHGSFSTQGIRDLLPAITLHTTSQEHTTRVDPQADLPHALDRDAALPDLHDLQAVVDTIPEVLDGSIEGVALLEWTPSNRHPDVVEPWLRSTGVVLERDDGVPDRVGLDSKTADLAVVLYGFAGSLERVIQGDGGSLSHELDPVGQAANTATDDGSH